MALGAESRSHKIVTISTQPGSEGEPRLDSLKASSTMARFGSRLSNSCYFILFRERSGTRLLYILNKMSTKGSGGMPPLCM